MKISVFMALLAILGQFTIFADLVPSVGGTIGCASNGFDTCLDLGNHCDLKDLMNSCLECVCVTGFGTTASINIDYGCAAVQVGLVKPMFYCPKAQKDVYHPTKVTIADLDNIKAVNIEAWFVLARLIIEKEHYYGLKVARAITAIGVPISQISDGQLQVPYITTICTTSTPVIPVSSTTVTATVPYAVVSTSSTVPQSYGVVQSYEVPQTYGVFTPVLSSTCSSNTIKSVSTVVVPESSTTSVVEVFPSYPGLPQVPKGFTNTSSTPRHATTVYFVPRTTTLYLTLVSSTTTTKVTVPTFSVGSSTYGTPTTSGEDTTTTTPTLTTTSTGIPTSTGGVAYNAAGAEAVAMVAAVGLALV